MLRSPPRVGTPWMHSSRPPSQTVRPSAASPGSGRSTPSGITRRSSTTCIRTTSRPCGMRPSRSSTRLAVPAFHDSYGPRYIRERSRKRESCRSGPIRSGVAPGGGRRSGALYLPTHYVEDGRSDKRDETPQTRGWRTRDGSAFGTGKGDALSSERFFGEMPGVPIGTLFSNRQVASRRRGSSAPNQDDEQHPDQAREGEVNIV